MQKNELGETEGPEGNYNCNGRYVKGEVRIEQIKKEWKGKA